MVWEARKDDSYIGFDYWLNIINLLSNNSPVIVVLNKTDIRDTEIDQALLKSNFNNIVSFHKVSCLTNRGINDLISEIKESIFKLPHVGIEWPNVWSSIRSELENDKRDFIEYRDYIEICERYGLNEEKANYLSSFLHDIGVILHFQDDDLLKRIVILKPEWGTNAVYKVLDTRKVQGNKGRFIYADLKDIWNDNTKYPSSKYYELLQLMIKFELCFKMVDSNTYIIPELLSPERPYFEWEYCNNLRFEYIFSFMPSGIITRFIVRNHMYIDDDCFWRNGVILIYERTRALIINDPLNRKIAIKVLGENQRELLAIIRKDFMSIFKTLNNLHVEEYISCNCSDCINDLSNANKYNYRKLVDRLDKNILDVECEKTYKRVSIKSLLSGIEDDNENVDSFVETNIEPVIVPNIIPNITHIYGNQININRSKEIEVTNEKISRERKPTWFERHIILTGIISSLVASGIWAIFNPEDVMIFFNNIKNAIKLLLNI